MNWVKAKTFNAFFMLIRVGSKQIQKCSRVNQICSHRQFCTWSIIHSFCLCFLSHITRDEQIFLKVLSVQALSSPSWQKNELTTKNQTRIGQKQYWEKKVFKLNYCFWAEEKHIFVLVLVFETRYGCISEFMRLFRSSPIFLIEKTGNVQAILSKFRCIWKVKENWTLDNKSIALLVLFWEKMAVAFL